MISKKAIWLGRLITVLVSLALMASASMKLHGVAESKEQILKLGFPESLIVPLGILETSCALIYLIPQTAVLGAILLTGYMGGAICTHLRVGEHFYIQAGLGVLAWLGIYLRDERLRTLLPMRRPRPRGLSGI